MKQLRAFGEIHPSNLYRDLTVALPSDIAKSLDTDYDDCLSFRPRSFADASFWKPFLPYFYESAAILVYSKPKQWEELCRSVFRDKTRPAKKLSLEVEVRMLVELLRTICEREFEIIDSGNYTTLFVEGHTKDGRNPIASYGQQRELHVVHLDDANPFYNIGSLDPVVQHKREQEWMRAKVAPLGDNVDYALMIIGEAHTDNEIGLIDTGRKYDIDIDVIGDTKDLRARVRQEFGADTQEKQ